jgi:hypothetical protein
MDIVRHIDGTRTESLCEVCNAILSDIGKMNYGLSFPHHSTLTGLVLAARAGCPQCHWVWKDVERICLGDDQPYLPKETEEESTVDISTRYRVTEKTGWYMFRTNDWLKEADVANKMLVKFNMNVDEVQFVALDCCGVIPACRTNVLGSLVHTRALYGVRVYSQSRSSLAAELCGLAQDLQPSISTSLSSVKTDEDRNQPYHKWDGGPPRAF